MFEAGSIFCAYIPLQDNAGRSMAHLSTAQSSPDWTDAVELAPKTSASHERSFHYSLHFSNRLSAENTGCSAREPVYETFLAKCFHFKKFIFWMRFRYMSKLLGKYPNHQSHLSLWQAMMASNINNLHSQY